MALGVNNFLDFTVRLNWCIVWKVVRALSVYKYRTLGLLLQSRVTVRDHTGYRCIPITSNIWRKWDSDGIVHRWVPVHSGVTKSPGLAGGTFACVV